MPRPTVPSAGPLWGRSDAAGSSEVALVLLTTAEDGDGFVTPARPAVATGVEGRARLFRCSIALRTLRKAL